MRFLAFALLASATFAQTSYAQAQPNATDAGTDSADGVDVNPADSNNGSVARDTGERTTVAPTPTAVATGPLRDLTLEPTGLLRTSIIYSTSDTSVVGGKTVDSSKADPSLFGYRQGFVLENAQFGVKGKSAESGLYYSARVEMVPREKDGNSSRDFLRDGYIGWNGLKVVDVRLGWQKVAFSQANLKGTHDQTLPYAPTFDVFTPTRQLGLTVAGMDTKERVKVTVGAFNSAKQALEQLTDSSQLMMAGRAEVNIDRFLGDDVGFKWRIGGGAAYTKKYFDNGQQRMWFGADTRARWRWLELEAEFVQMQFFTDAASDGSQPVHAGSGWHTDLTGWLLDDRVSITGRIEQMDGDDTLTDGQSLIIDTLARQKKQWMTLGVGYTHGKVGRCILAWIHRSELEGFELANDNGQLTCHVAF